MAAHLLDGLLHFLLPLATPAAVGPALAGWPDPPARVELQRAAFECLGSLFVPAPTAGHGGHGGGGHGGGGHGGGPPQSPRAGGGRGRGRGRSGGTPRGRGQRWQRGGGKGGWAGGGRELADARGGAGADRLGEARRRVWGVVETNLPAYASAYGSDAAVGRLLCAALRCATVRPCSHQTPAARCVLCVLCGCVLLRRRT